MTNSYTVRQNVTVFWSVRFQCFFLCIWSLRDRHQSQPHQWQKSYSVDGLYSPLFSLYGLLTLLPFEHWCSHFSQDHRVLCRNDLLSSAVWSAYVKSTFFHFAAWVSRNWFAPELAPTLLQSPSTLPSIPQKWSKHAEELLLSSILGART